MKNKRLVSARKTKKLTQEKLAEILGCRKTSVSNWENGYSKPKLSDALKVAEILEHDVEYLFSDVKIQETHTEPA